MSRCLINTLLCCVFVLLFGCSQEAPDDTHTKASQAQGDGSQNDGSQNSSIEEAVFDRAQVLEEYKEQPLTVLDVSEREWQGQNAIAVTLSVPLDPAKNHQQYLDVSQKDSGKMSGKADGAWVLSPSGKVLWFTHTEPNTAYDITIYQGLTAATDRQLALTKTVSLTTRDLKPSVSFDSKGHFLTAGLGNGIPVTAVNIDAVNVDFFRIDDQQLHSFLREFDRFYYWRIQDMTHFGELAYSGRFELNTPKNTRTKRTLDVENITQLNAPGVYLAVMLPAGEYTQPKITWFSVTDIGLHAREYQQRLDVHVSSLKTGKALSGVSVLLLDDHSAVVGERTSTPEGIVTFQPIPQNVQHIIAQTDTPSGQHFSHIPFRQPALDLSEFDIGKRPQLPVEFYIYAPRDLYRPGEMIDFNGLLRDFDGKKTAPAIMTAKIKKPDGSVMKTFKWHGQALGYYHYAWNIPVSAPVGNWELVVEGAFDKPVVFPFKVEEFLPERMKLTFNEGNEKPEIIQRQASLTIPILGEYLYGAPAAGNRLSTLVNVSPWRLPIESLQHYQFGDATEKNTTQQFGLDDITLSADGNADIVAKASHWRHSQSPLRIQLVSSVYESGGRPVTRAYSSLMWPAETVIGIRPDFSDDNPEANSRVGFDIVNATAQGELKAASGLDVKLIREDRQYFWVFDDNRGWHYEWTDKEFTEITQTVSIAEGKSTHVEFPVSYGRYRMEVRNPETGLISNVRFYAGYNWYANWKAAQNNQGVVRPDKVAVVLDKGAYQPGEVAQVKITPPEAGEAIIMVEADEPLWMKRLSIPDEGITIEIPVSEEWNQHNTYVTATVLRPGNNKKTITPKRSFGLAHLPLDRQDRSLSVVIDAPDETLPQETLMVDITIDEALSGVKIPTEETLFVTLAAVDVGVLNISNFKTPNPEEAFFGKRQYGIESKDLYGKVIELSQADKASIRFGGDADMARGGQAPQSDVQIVSLFSGVVKMNNGKTSIPVELPDFNGRLRLMALAFSDNQFGHQEKDITVAAPLVTQLSMPRFLAMGDLSSLALDIHNLSGERQHLDVSLSVSGAMSLRNDDAEKTTMKKVVLDDQKKTTLHFPVKATDFSGQGIVQLSIESENETDQSEPMKPLHREWKLGMRPAYSAVNEYRSTTLKKGDSIQLGEKDLLPYLSGSVDATVVLSPSVDLGLRNQFENLLRYPYGCLEQTSSRAFPFVYATKENQERFGLPAITQQERFKRLQEGVDRVATMQLGNGGFGLWNNRSPEEHWLTAFVTDFLLLARDAGAEVPPSLLDNALKRLKRYVNRSGRFVGERWSEDQNHYSFAYKAYSAYVLSKVNQAPLGTLRNLYDRQFKRAQSGLPKVHLGIALMNMGDKKRGRAALEASLQTFPERTKYLGDYGSPIRDKALAIHLLLSNHYFTQEAMELSLSLAKEIHDRRWLSTQERNALFLAGIELSKAGEGRWTGEVILNQLSQTLSQQGMYQQVLDDHSINNGFSFTSTNDEILFSNVHLMGYPKNKPEPFESGLSIHRQWYNQKGELVSPDNVEVGDLFIVHLELSANSRTPDALVVDFIPAGFEIENQNLEHAIQLESFTIDGKSIEQLQRRSKVKHQEFRDDRFVAAMDINTYNRTHIFYVLRAVTPGDYQVPAPTVEDMYRPERRAVGETVDRISVTQPNL
ncbi:alpha-2-macroglobulin family protein [Marinibactrum halimedae]|uniref:Alpha-2-macroglobulin n=1 Tax=Marinibactrum halimedae TaxID=1444977 RepID=A0AA37T8K0_9GAMM|nr:alpha-2-macroglobulin [Marinibactrum halimedae]MCD9458786.1 alpha-2-macroglobulin family protein [Marinibactrum halimedae]GLS25345.1 lipoprotein [Marinibactrum halimedae]